MEVEVNVCYTAGQQTGIGKKIQMERALGPVERDLGVVERDPGQVERAPEPVARAPGQGQGGRSWFLATGP